MYPSRTRAAFAVCQTDKGFRLVFLGVKRFFLVLCASAVQAPPRPPRPSSGPTPRRSADRRRTAPRAPATSPPSDGRTRWHGALPDPSRAARPGPHPSAEVLLEAGDDRPCRGYGELLARDLEDQRAERVEHRQLVHPRARTESGPRIDQLGENRVRVPEELPGPPVRERGALHFDAHSFESLSVSTISITSATVSSRAQSRWSSTASATQVTGCAPAWTTRWTPVRCASSLVPPIASTTG